MDENWLKTTNEEVKSSINRRRHENCKVLGLYWEASNEGFKTECRAVLDLFGDAFHYVTEEYVIPKDSAEMSLMSKVAALLSEASHYSTFIIYYGGHGDLDDDKHGGQECQSVWADCGTANRGTTLRWYKIQEVMRDSVADILLILDCCYAAQAGRGSNNRRGRFEILAAAAMKTQTRGPGRQSFTTILLDEIRNEVTEKGSFNIKETHGRLCNRKYNLWATPVHIVLAEGHSSMRLEPLLVSTESNSGVSDVGNTFLHVLLQVRENCTNQNAEEVRQWLREDLPRVITHMTVSHKPKDAGDTQGEVTTVQRAWYDCIEHAAKADILKAWKKVEALLREHEFQDSLTQNLPCEEETLEFVSRLDMRSHDVVDALERGILMSPTANEEVELESTMNDKVVQGLQVSNQLRMRQIIIELPNNGQRHEITVQTPSHPAYQQPLLKEYKEYGIHMDRDLPSIQRRVEKLAALLKAPKSSEFRALRCLDVSHRPTEKRFEFSFEVPTEAEGCIWTHRPHQNLEFEDESSADRCCVSLHELILGANRRKRPSLNQRLRISHQLAKAVQKWHTVGWVHQGITSSNIIFFQKDGSVDYHHPFLHGFAFSRPDTDPSIGRDESTFEVNLYRHPDRQGSERKGYQKIHDMYSLGVVMLEIGLWQSAKAIVTLSIKHRDSLLAQDVRKIFKSNCKERLPHFAGESYMSAVAVCLASAWSVELDDKAGSHLSREFQARVIDKLAKGVEI